MTTQTDPANVRTLVHDATGAEVESFFGCILDVNQSAQAVFPLNPSSDGPFGGTLQSVLSLVRNAHQCLVAEIAFDPDAIAAGATPSTSDKLAQRNLSLVESDNPGGVESRRIPNTFEVRPTPAVHAAAGFHDELMIDWGNVPAGSVARVYLPDTAPDEVLDLAKRLYRARGLQRIDAHTLQMRAPRASPTSRCPPGRRSTTPGCSPSTCRPASAGPALLGGGPPAHPHGAHPQEATRGGRQPDRWSLVAAESTGRRRLPPAAGSSSGKWCSAPSRSRSRSRRGPCSSTPRRGCSRSCAGSSARSRSRDRWYLPFRRYVAEIGERVPRLRRRSRHGEARSERTAGRAAAGRPANPAGPGRRLVFTGKVSGTPLRPLRRLRGLHPRHRGRASGCSRAASTRSRTSPTAPGSERMLIVVYARAAEPHGPRRSC